ncbi:hypothetical protein EDD11_006482 [Mortierella claussenii]|nr:hypothetical protein EDD11_006482 [Mortierella claussenii]
MANTLVLKDTPAATVSCMTFHKTTPDLLLVSSWDKKVLVYNTKFNARLVNNTSHSGPVLACCWGRNSDTFSAGIDGSVRRGHVGSQETLLGTHTDTVTSLAFSVDRNIVVSGSWDNTVRMWDERASKAAVQTISMKAAVNSLDVFDNRLIVGVGGDVTEYDMNNLLVPTMLHSFRSPFKKRVLKIMPRGIGFAGASVDGRVWLSYWKDAHAAYSFKASRHGTAPQAIYPVNAIAFHPIEETFVTGSSDGSVISWDGFKKSRLATLHNPDSLNTSSAPVSALAYSSTGSHLAIATGDTFDQGHPGYGSRASILSTRICIRPMQLSEVAYTKNT